MSADPYAALVTLAERERDLVHDGRIEELAALATERDALIGTLPVQAPPSARPALERALALQTATAAMLRASLAEVRHSIAGLDRGRGIARAYTGVAAATAGAARIDQAA